MYNHHLSTFIEVADSGSFLKAADKMYISATAVTKQINLLEQHLDIKLFHRGHQGLSLTEAGKVIYDEAKNIIQQSEQVLRKARELEEREEYVIRVGVSLMNTSKILMEQWAKASALYPNVKLQIVPFEDNMESFSEVMDHFGRDIDVIPCANRSPMWDDLCHSFHLRDIPICISVPKSHKLAGRELLSVSDLYDEQLIIIKQDRYPGMDVVRDELINHPRIQIQDVELYDLNAFNRAVSDNNLMLVAECWSDVHPLLVTIPVDWKFTIPYGLIYAKEPAKEVLQFIMAIGKVN